MNRRQRHSVTPALRWVAAACALAIWLLGIFSASSQLHGALHADAGEAGHACSITLFSHGVEDSTGLAVIVVAPAVFPAGEISWVAAAPRESLVDRLPPGRGPPLC
jgi:hypothetical protein